MPEKNTHLFNSESIEFAKCRLHGDVLVRPRISHSLMLVGLIAWISLFVCVIFMAKWTHHERIEGVFKYDQNTGRVHAHIYLPSELYPHIKYGDLINVQIKNSGQSSKVRLKVYEISSDLLAVCPLCDYSSNRSPLYLSVLAKPLGSFLQISSNKFELNGGIRFDFNLPTYDINAIKIIRSIVGVRGGGL